MFMNIKVYIKE